MGVYDGGVTLANSAEQSLARDRVLRAEYAKALHDKEHYWVASFMYRVTPPIQAGQPFDFENLRAGPVLMCYVCEEPYSPDISPVCPGEQTPVQFWSETYG